MMHEGPGPLCRQPIPMRRFPVSRPGSFLPVYAIIVAGVQLWLAYILIGAGRTWLLYDAQRPWRFVPVALDVLLGLGAIALWIAAWVVRRRGDRPVGTIAFRIAAVACLIVLYALSHIAGHWLGFL